ncbi:hypothetical protein [Pseudomonas fluorescens]|uniref:hypothetical protein n=1 Tax=Pseudomonas fluorescens TaxID=294 RepID=UPI001C442BBC|nr:hypothetical protein [Pseudomonas fluorescens]QXN50469.1 hypothetical protein KW062_01435 [Pseudomonas fluorescens]WSO24785.1 hypothetical protein VUJ50_01445 [Pseudomonas fluorescens]
MCALICKPRLVSIAQIAGFEDLILTVALSSGDAQRAAVFVTIVSLDWSAVYIALVSPPAFNVTVAAVAGV